MVQLFRSTLNKLRIKDITSNESDSFYEIAIDLYADEYTTLRQIMDTKAEEFGNLISNHIATNSHVPKSIFYEIICECKFLLESYLLNSGFNRRDIDVLRSTAEHVVKYKARCNALIEREALDKMDIR